MYILFAGDQYYPSGGWRDFAGSFETLEEAQKKQLRLRKDWSHIINTETLKIVRNTEVHSWADRDSQPK